MDYMIMMCLMAGTVVGFLIGFLSANWNAHKRWDELEQEMKKRLLNADR